MFWTAFWGVIAALIVLPLIVYGLMKAYLFFDQRRTPAGSIDWLGVLSFVILIFVFIPVVIWGFLIHFGI